MNTIVKLLKNYVRGFDAEIHPGMAPGYTVQSIPVEPDSSRELSIVVLSVTLAIFWLGMENYMDIILCIISLCTKRRG